jgi:DNA mismatch repair protein MSH6
MKGEFTCLISSRVLIPSRLDAVEGIMDNPHFDETFSKVVKGLPDLERIIARVHAKSCAVKDFLKLLNAYGRLQSGFDELASSVQSIESGLLRRLLEVPAGLEVMIAAIKSMFEEPGKEFCSRLMRLLNFIRGKGLRLGS